MQQPAVSFIANIVNEVELKNAETGPWLRLRVAVNNRRLDRERDVWVDGKTSFFTVVCWRDLAENCFRSLRKGQTIMVAGRLETNEYTTGDGETRREEARIVADHIGHSLRWGTTSFEKRAGRRPEATVQGEGAEAADQVFAGVRVDTATGEITDLGDGLPDQRGRAESSASSAA